MDKTLGDIRKEIAVIAETLIHGTKEEKDAARDKIQRMSPRHKIWLNMAMIQVEIDDKEKAEQKDE